MIPSIETSVSMIKGVRSGSNTVVVDAMLVSADSVGGVAVVVSETVEPPAHPATMPRAITEIREKHKMRYLFLPELEHFLDTESWSKHDACEWLKNVAPSDSSWSAFVIATRK